MLFRWLQPRRNPEVDLKRLKDGLHYALGDKFKSMVVFGSFASGEYRPGHSNVNVLIIADITPSLLEQMGPSLNVWLKKGHVVPVLVETEGLDEFARDFPIEFLDMKDEHRLLWGENPFATLTVDKKHLKAQCEHDLALVQLRLRQAIAIAEGRRDLLVKALEQSLPSVMALCRAAVRLEENASKLDKIKAADQLAVRVGFEGSVLHRLHDLRLKRASDNIQDLAARYLDVIGAVLNYLRK